MNVFNELFFFYCNEYKAKAERLMFLDAQSRAEEESLASRSASSGPVIRLKVYNFSAIMLSIKDFIDVRNAIGVNLNVNIGTHNFVLKRYYIPKNNKRIFNNCSQSFLFKQYFNGKYGRFRRRYGNGHQLA